jgi:hypothetical protein
MKGFSINLILIWYLEYVVIFEHQEYVFID